MDFVFTVPPPPPTPLRAAIRDSHLSEESAAVARILDAAALSAEMRQRIVERARRLVAVIRRERVRAGGIDAFLHEYDLSSEEGVLLMCLAEALLRIPDADTAERLIADKLSAADWQEHLGKSESLFVNASTWGLMLTGRLVRAPETAGGFRAAWSRLVSRTGEP